VWRLDTIKKLIIYTEIMNCGKLYYFNNFGQLYKGIHSGTEIIELNARIVDKVITEQLVTSTPIILLQTN